MKRAPIFTIFVLGISAEIPFFRKFDAGDILPLGWTKIEIQKQAKRYQLVQDAWIHFAPGKN